MNIITNVIPVVITILKVVAPLLITYIIIRIAATFIKGYVNFIDAINTITASKGRLLFVALLVFGGLFGFYKLINMLGI